MLGRKVEHMLMGRIAEERASLSASVEGFGDEGDLTPAGHEAADREAPVSIEIIDDPIVARHCRQLVHDVGQMGGPICTGAGEAQIPHEVSSRDDQRGQQRAHTMADILVFTFFRLARLYWLGRIGTLQNLHARLFVGTDDHTALLVEAQRIDIEERQVMGLGLEGRVMAVEPIDAAMRFEVGLMENPPDAGATHRPVQTLLVEGCDHVVETPAGGRTVVSSRLAGGH